MKDLTYNSNWAGTELDAMELMLRSGHFSPTSPFSLKTEPFLEDYFVMGELPHVMISGKSKNWERRKVKVGESEVLLVTIP